MSLPQRRFGRTELSMPVLSLGGMRYQKSWKELSGSEITKDDQNKVDKIFNLASKYGFDHIETARYYGTSEFQLGKAIENIGKLPRIIQTKIPPNENPKAFEEELKISFERLGVKKIDLVAIHGINTNSHLYNAIRDGGCIDILYKWQSDNLIGHIGFSTHANLSLIEKAICSNKFDYVNLHWYFINQQNLPAINLAKKFDMGVFIISPTDKGGHLYEPSEKLLEICKPLHPIVFNDLFCLRNKDVHTISVGVEKNNDFDLHLEAVYLLSKQEKYIPMILDKFKKESINCLGIDWYLNWNKNLPKWEDTPGKINIPVLIWLSNLLEAFDMNSFVRSRYQLLGNGSHWFPGNNANSLDVKITENELLDSLKNYNQPQKVIQKLRKLKTIFGDNQKERLSQS